MAENDVKVTKISLKEKLSILQSEISVPKSLYNSFGKYSYRNAEGILEAIKPHLKKMRITLNLEDDIQAFGERLFVKATASLFDLDTDDTFKTVAYAEIDDHKGMSKDQAVGCASSYARKYALNGLLLLDDAKDEDTDEFKRENDAKAEKKSSSSNTSSTNKNYSQPAQKTEGAKTNWGLK